MDAFPCNTMGGMRKCILILTSSSGVGLEVLYVARWLLSRLMICCLKFLLFFHNLLRILDSTSLQGKKSTCLTRQAQAQRTHLIQNLLRAKGFRAVVAVSAAA
mmetsp:Transcript_7346/g.13308  ORF Transcript_7346/g.13308 Transcript_7346/m.13308 type:complete len:103 (+) Transcript_7346:730-1038(+)